MEICKECGGTGKITLPQSTTTGRSDIVKCWSCGGMEIRIAKPKINLSDIDKEISDILIRNGLTKSTTDEYTYINDFCALQIQEDGYAISDNEGNTYYTLNHTFYTVVGYLIHSKFINKYER